MYRPREVLSDDNLELKYGQHAQLILDDTILLGLHLTLSLSVCLQISIEILLLLFKQSHIVVSESRPMIVSTLWDKPFYKKRR